MSSGISIATALTIKNNGDNIVCSAGQDANAQKWCGFIHLLKDGHVHCEVLSTIPFFDSKEAAEQHMKDLVKEIREMDLSDPALQAPGRCAEQPIET